MNNDGTSGIGGDSESLTSKVNFIYNRLVNQKTEESADPTYLKNMQDMLFPEEKENRSRFRGLKQKQKVFQAVPIAVDGITPNGKKEIQRTLKGLLSFDMDTKKPDVKSGPWAKLFFILAFVIGFIIGSVLGFLDQIRKFFKFLNNTFKSIYGFLKETNIGKFLSGLFKSLKLKILQGISAIKNFKIVQIIKGFFESVRQTVIGWKAALKDSTIFKTLKSLFDGAKTRIDNIFSTVKSFLGRIQNFFKPITDFFGKFNLTKMIPTGAFKLFTGFISKLGVFFQMGLKAGKLFGKVLAPLFLVIELVAGFFKSFTDDKLKDKSFLQKALTGFFTGILEFLDIFEIFGLDLFSFEEIRDDLEKIFKPFREGKWLEGIGQIFNQLLSNIIGGVGKVVGWVVGWFDKDLGKKITEFFKKFDIFEMIGQAFDSITNWVTGLWEKITGFLKRLFGSINDLITWDNLKKLVTLDWGNIGSKETKTEPKKVGDFVDSGDRTLYSQGEAYQFDNNDEIIAMKSGGPIDNILRTSTEETNKSIDNLTKVVSDLSKNLGNYIKTTTAMQQAEQKIMIENVNLLKSIRDKENSSNVLVQNSNSNTVFNERGTSNLDFRKEMSYLANF